VFSDIEDWNDRALQWLQRTGNHQVHQTTKKRPAEVFLLEKQHLQPVSSLLSYESTSKQCITRTVSKDNTIRYKSNRYSVPLGTYQTMSENLVWIEVTNEEQQTLVIRKKANGEIITEHFLVQKKGNSFKTVTIIAIVQRGLKNLSNVSSLTLKIRLRQLCILMKSVKNTRGIVVTNLRSSTR
jgi:hypothetical protein